jgi:hypothetical protein
MKRKKLTKKASRKQFKKGTKINAKNFKNSPLSRGGIRL